MQFTVKPLGNFHKSLLFNAMEEFQKTKSVIEAATVAVVALTYGLETLETFDLKRNPSGALTLESMQAVMRLDTNFTTQIVEQIWLASFGTPANLSIVPKSETTH